jgi:hypothetical protein
LYLILCYFLIFLLSFFSKILYLRIDKALAFEDCEAAIHKENSGRIVLETTSATIGGQKMDSVSKILLHYRRESEVGSSSSSSSTGSSSSSKEAAAHRHRKPPPSSASKKKGKVGYKKIKKPSKID